MGAYGQITVVRQGHIARVLLDGQELEHVARDKDVRVVVDPDGVPTVRVTLMARRVDVMNTLSPANEKQEKSL